MPFPKISWWSQHLAAERTLLNLQEHYNKSAPRNRYPISGANNPLTLSIPLQDGREQRRLITEIKIFNLENWQIKHWRTLVSAYRRSPYFDHYEPSLQPLFGHQFESLAEFNLQTIDWVCKALKVPTIESVQGISTLETPKSLKGAASNDSFPEYYQVFRERIGFQPDLSILDLLFSLGPQAKEWILKHHAQIMVSG